jgi:Helix-turn-helix domain
MAEQDTAKALAVLDDAPAFISVMRAATILGFSRASAYRYAAAGELPTKRFGRRVYVITAKLRELISGGEAA